MHGDGDGDGDGDGYGDGCSIPLKSKVKVSDGQRRGQGSWVASSPEVTTWCEIPSEDRRLANGNHSYI